MGSGFDDWIYWHIFTITVDYKNSHIELLLNDVYLTNLSLLSESRTGLCSLELSLARIEAESYVTADGQPASLS
jgi:hypothetical protein